MKIPTEAQEQQALIELIIFKMPALINYVVVSANGGLRHKLVAKSLKKQGVRKGVADIFIASPAVGVNTIYHGFWIELKRKNATRSCVRNEQVDFLKTMQKQGYAATVYRGCDEAFAGIESYIKGNYRQFSANNWWE